MADENTRMSNYLAEDIVDNIDEVREARGEYDSLDERLDEIESGGFTPTQAQLDAINSGITDDDVEQIDLNKNNILSVADQSTQYNLINLHNPIAVRYVVPTYLSEGGVTLDVNNATWTAFNISYPAMVGIKYKFVVTITATTGLNNFHVFIRDTDTEGTNVAEYPYGINNATINSVGTHVFEFTATATTMWIGIYPNNSSTAVTGSVTMKAQVIEKSLYDAGFTDYQPYALSNTAITPALQECVDNGVKNRLPATSTTTSTNNGLNLVVNSDYSITITGTMTTVENTDIYFLGSWTNTSPFANYTGKNMRIYCKSSASINGQFKFYNRTANKGYAVAFNNNEGTDISGNLTAAYFTIGATANAINVTLYPMICESSSYIVSQQYVPPAMSNAELTEEVIPLAKGIKLVAHTSNNGNTSLSYDTNINDFDIGSNTDKNSGVYLIVCNNWSTTPAPYIGLLTFSGATTNHFVKTDVVTGFTPTISITENTANATIAISGAAKISIYAVR